MKPDKKQCTSAQIVAEEPLYTDSSNIRLVLHLALNSSFQGARALRNVCTDITQAALLEFSASFRFELPAPALLKRRGVPGKAKA